MSEQKHTKEPWRQGDPDSDAVYGADGELLTVTIYNHPKAKANIRRIVASVNACEGIETEALESGPLKVIWDKLEAIAKAGGQL